MRSKHPPPFLEEYDFPSKVICALKSLVFSTYRICRIWLGLISRYRTRLCVFDGFSVNGAMEILVSWVFCCDGLRWERGGEEGEVNKGRWLRLSPFFKIPCWIMIMSIPRLSFFIWSSALCSSLIDLVMAVVAVTN